MSYEDFLDRVIAEGIQGAEEDYAGSTPSKILKRTGAVQGFRLCKDCTPEQLKELYGEAGKKVDVAYKAQAQDYWYWRCYQSEIEWVCNVVSAMLTNEGREPLAAHFPTARGMIKASAILSES